MGGRAYQRFFAGYAYFSGQLTDEANDEADAKERIRNRHRRAIIERIGKYGVNFQVWRPVLHQIATPYEIRQRWTFLDLYEAHLVLDVRDELAEYNRSEAEKDMKREP